MIKNTNGAANPILLRNASSGMQTVSPLSLIVEYYARKFDAQKSMNSSLFGYLQDNDRLKDFSTAKTSVRSAPRTSTCLLKSQN